ncbi:hypothetical protein LZ32DRAFT_60141 [Colletotrichum eremochloae]|nr:hypothetical protein LZ32DRAFT_60141 [Colletotrichum eremochloae]
MTTDRRAQDLRGDTSCCMLSIWMLSRSVLPLDQVQCCRPRDQTGPICGALLLKIKLKCNYWAMNPECLSLSHQASRFRFRSTTGDRRVDLASRGLPRICPAACQPEISPSVNPLGSRVRLQATIRQPSGAPSSSLPMHGGNKTETIKRRLKSLISTYTHAGKRRSPRPDAATTHPALRTPPMGGRWAPHPATDRDKHHG